MRTAVAALVLVALVTLSIAEGNGFRISEKSEVKNWETDSKLLSTTEKRDIAYDEKYKFEVLLSGSGSATAFSNSKLTLSGMPEKSNGALIKDVTITGNRYNNRDRETTLVFDVDFGGKDVIPSTSSYYDLRFRFNFPSYRNKGSVDSYTIYAWQHDASGYPTAQFDDEPSSSFNGEFTTEYLYYIRGFGFTRFVIIVNLDDSAAQCPLAIDNYSLLESACIAPESNGKPKYSQIDISQIFQDAGNVAPSDLKFTVKNCYGYDKKICQKVYDIENSVIFSQTFQAIAFNKPCRGVPSEYACVTTVDVEYKKGSCKTKAQVLIPVNKKAIQNKYGKASCRIVPEYKDVSSLDQLFASGAASLKEECAHYVGCFERPADAQQWYPEYISGDGGLGYTVQSPYSASQCKTICKDASPSYKYFFIHDGGVNCGCLSDDDYDVALNKRDALPNAQCSSAGAECPFDPDYIGGMNKFCGTDENVIVYNIEACHRIGNGYNYDENS